MFQSYDWWYLGYDDRKDEYRYAITVWDDDFTDTADVSVSLIASVVEGEAVEPASAIIHVYLRRGLNVAKNLWLLHECCNRRWGRWSGRLNYWLEHIPEYAPYHDDVLFYLTFT